MKDVVVLGGAAVDWVALVDRLPAQDGLVVASRFEKHPGGSAANVATGIARQGHTVGFVGQLGDDANGQLLRQAFERDGVDISRVINRVGEPTASCFIAVDRRGERIIVALPGASLLADPTELDLDYLDCQLLYIGPNRPEVAQAALDAAQRWSPITVFAPGGGWGGEGLGLLLPILARVDLLLVSRREAIELSGTADVSAGLARLRSFGPGAVVETLGAAGAIVLAGEQTISVPAVRAVQVNDTTGAGDAFAAGMVTGLLAGADLPAAMRRGSATAALKICALGARGGQPDRAAVDRLLEK